MSIAAVLLAAGLSTRFGAVDKIVAPLEGLPLGLHAARTLTDLGLGANFVISGDVALDWPHFAIVRNDRPEAGIAHSIRLGVEAARACGAEAVLIALADMPFVPIGHFRTVIGLHRGPASLVASSDGERRMPPALFGSAWFDTLDALRGDQGARSLLDRAGVVQASPEVLIDIDQPDDLSAARRPLRD